MIMEHALDLSKHKQLKYSHVNLVKLVYGEEINYSSN